MHNVITGYRISYNNMCDFMLTRTLALYIIRRILTPFSLALIVLLMVLSLERLLRLVEIVTQQSAPAWKIFEFLFYLLPHYMGLALPIALFLGIFLATRRLQDDSELHAIQNIGLSPRYLYKPVVVIIIPATLFLFLLNGYIQPHARYTYRAAVHELTVDNPLAGLRPGTFIDIGEGSMLRAETIAREAGYLEGIFIAHDTEKSPERLAISAQSGRIIYEQDTRRPILRLENGNVIREHKISGKQSKLSFESYPWRLPGALGEAYGLRGQDEREMTLVELTHGRVHNVEPESNPAQNRAELHVRLVQALSLPFLALWALPLALMGSTRAHKGKAQGLIWGIAILVIYEKIIGLGEANAANGGGTIWLNLWGPWAVLGLSGWLFMRYKIPTVLSTASPSKAVF